MSKMYKLYKNQKVNKYLCRKPRFGEKATRNKIKYDEKERDKNRQCMNIKFIVQGDIIFKPVCFKKARKSSKMGIFGRSFSCQAGSIDFKTRPLLKQGKMKLKDFVYSTLPKKNKKSKRRQIVDTILPSKYKQQDTNEIKPNDTFPLEFNNRNLVTEDFCYKDFDNGNHSNVNLCANDYYELDKHSQDFRFPSDVSPPVISTKSAECCYPFEFSEFNCNTVPRQRSKIKTNPWVNSPGVSPASSGVTSPMTSSLGSSVLSDSEYHTDGFYNLRQDNYERSTSASDSSFTESGFSSGHIMTGSWDDSVSSAYEMSATVDRKVRHPANTLERDYIEGYIMTGETFYNKNTAVPQEESEVDDCFSYEQELEMKLEPRNDDDVIGSRVDIFEAFGSCENLDMGPPPYCDDYEGSDFYDDFQDMDAVFYEANPTEEEQMAHVEDTLEPFNLYNNANQCDDIINDSLEEDENSFYGSEQTEVYYKGYVDLNTTENHENCDNFKKSFPMREENGKLTPSRDIETSHVSEVRKSLREKVRMLKMEKEVVDHIVKRAKEERQLKELELIKIQKETSLARREILLRTLVELREKLESQTDRLQVAYERIVRLQYQNKLKAKLQQL